MTFSWKPSKSTPKSTCSGMEQGENEATIYLWELHAVATQQQKIWFSKWAWWLTSINPALGRLKQAECWIQGSLGHITNTGPAWAKKQDSIIHEQWIFWKNFGGIGSSWKGTKGGKYKLARHSRYFSQGKEFCLPCKVFAYSHKWLTLSLTSSKNGQNQNHL